MALFAATILDILNGTLRPPLPPIKDGKITRYLIIDNLLGGGGVGGFLFDFIPSENVAWTIDKDKKRKENIGTGSPSSRPHFN